MSGPRLLVVVPPHASSMGNGPPIAPFLLRYYLGDSDVHVELFDANAHFFRFLLLPEIRAQVTGELKRELAHYLGLPTLSSADLTRVGRFLSFLASDYAQGRDFPFSRAGFDWAGVNEVFLAPPGYVDNQPWRHSLWDRALDHLVDKLLERQPDHVAFSALFHTQCEALAGISARLRQRGFPGRIILGGAAIKLSDDAYLSRLMERAGADLAYRFNLYDSLTALGGYLRGEVPVEAVGYGSHLVAGGRLRHQFGEPRRARRLAGPLSYWGIESQLYFADHVFPILLSEGCYWGKCEFCDYPYLASQDPFVISALFRAPADVIADARALNRDYCVTQIDLISDAVPMNYFQRLRDAGGEELPSLGIHLGCSIRAEPRAAPRHFAAMAACGVDSITIGVESLCDDVLAGMKKGNTYQDILRSMRMARDAGVRVKANIIYDYPRMELRHVDQTLERLQEIAPFIEAIGIHSFGLTPHSPLAHDASAAGLRVISGSPKETNDHGEHHLRFVRAGMDPELRGAFDLLNQELLALSFDLDRRRDAVHYNGERVMALPYRWSGEVAVRAPERGDLWVRIPGPRQPFLFFVGEHESR